MALDVLRNLVDNIPDWLQRLGDLSGQIDRRQAELAAVAAAEGKSPETKSLRNKGSTESLKPKYVPPVYVEASANKHIPENTTNEKAAQAPVKEPETPRVHISTPGSIHQQPKASAKRPAQGNHEDERERKKHNLPYRTPFKGTGEDSLFFSSSPGPMINPIDNPPSYEDVMRADAATQNTTQKIVRTSETTKAYTPNPVSILQEQDINKPGQAKARPEAIKKSKSPPYAASRTGSKISVYYDSYALGFFDELHEFILKSGNLIRKAKTAARAAQIKKLAEKDVSDYDNDDALSSLRPTSSRIFGPMSISRSGVGGRLPDVYDNVDEGLKFVQSTCDHGAHQFLRDGGCNDKISKIQKRLGEVLEMAQAEMDRVQREEPELAKVIDEMGNPTPLKESKPSKLEAAEPSPAGNPMMPLASDLTHGDGVFAVSLDNGRGPEIARADSHLNDERHQQAPKRLTHQRGRTKLPSSPRKRILSPRRKGRDEHQTLSTHSVVSVDIPPYTTNAAYTRAQAEHSSATVTPNNDDSGSTSSKPTSLDATPATDCMSIDGMTHSKPVSGRYACEFPGCDVAPFKKEYLLKSHMKVHSSERPHCCPVKGCPKSEEGKGFKRENDLRRHGLVHNSPGYVCPFCSNHGWKYPRPDLLRRHVGKSHPEKTKDDQELQTVLDKRPNGSYHG